VWWKEAKGIVNPQGCDPLFLAQRERVEIRLSHGLARFVHHVVTYDQVGGNETRAHVAVTENPQFEHFLTGVSILTMLDDAGHGMPLPRAGTRTVDTRRKLECDTHALLDLLFHEAFGQIVQEVDGEPTGR
jgi:hypothetical protein